MRKFLWLILVAVPAMAQVSNPQIVIVSSDPSGAVSCSFPWRWNALGSGSVWYPANPSGGSCTWTQIGSGGGSGTVNAGTTGQLAYYPGNAAAVSGATSFANTLAFTPGQVNQEYVFNGNTVNIPSEFTSFQVAYHGGGPFYSSDEEDIALSVPGTSTAFNAVALGLYMTCGSTTTDCEPLYTQARRTVAGAPIWGANINAWDGGFGGANMFPLEVDGFVGNASTTGELVRFYTYVTAGAIYNGIHFVPAATGGVTNGILLDNGSAITAINIGTQASGGNSMPVQFANTGINSTLALSSNNQLASSAAIAATSYQTLQNCISSVSPSLCGSASAGLVAVPTGGTTLVVDTTSVGASSEINLTFDSSLGTALGVTCNATVNQPTVSARTAGTSFTITMGASVSVNPACISYNIFNAGLPVFQTSDTFSGNPGNALIGHTDNLGHGWTSYSSVTGNTPTTTFQLTGDGRVATVNQSVSYIADVLNALTPSSANYTVSGTCEVGSASGGCVLYGRALTAAYTTYYLYCDVTNGCGIFYRLNGGAQTQVGSWATSQFTASATHTIALSMVGTSITATLDGLPLVGVGGTDSHVTATGQAGMRLNGNGIMSNFTVQ